MKITHDSGLEAEYRPNAIARPDALYAAVRALPELSQGTVRVYGKEYAEPRLTAWYGARPYAYSGTVKEAHPMPEALEVVRLHLQDVTGAQYNSALVNVYRNGQDSVSWHADDEVELGPEPTIASVSLGSTRRFGLKSRDGSERRAVDLEHASLLIMAGLTQQEWLHAVAKTAKPVGPRVNVTFRLMA